MYVGMNAVCGDGLAPLYTQDPACVCVLRKEFTDTYCAQEGNSSIGQHNQKVGVGDQSEVLNSTSTRVFVLQSCLKLLKSCEPGPEQHAVTIGKVST